MALTSPAGVTVIIGGLSLIPLTATTMIAGSLQKSPSYTLRVTLDSHSYLVCIVSLKTHCLSIKSGSSAVISNFTCSKTFTIMIHHRNLQQHYFYLLVCAQRLVSGYVQCCSSGYFRTIEVVFFTNCCVDSQSHISSISCVCLQLHGSSLDTINMLLNNIVYATYT